MDLTIHRTGRSDEVFVVPISTRGRNWLAKQFGLFAQYGHRMQVDNDDLRAFERELTQDGITFE
jgi:hypothetical protein